MRLRRNVARSLVRVLVHSLAFAHRTTPRSSVGSIQLALQANRATPRTNSDKAAFVTQHSDLAFETLVEALKQFSSIEKKLDSRPETGNQFQWQPIETPNGSVKRYESGVKRSERLYGVCW